MDDYKKKEQENKDLEASAGLLGHTYKYVSGGGHSDSYVCSCGWKSEPYWDGAEYALSDWRKHAKKIVSEGQAHLNLGTP